MRARREVLPPPPSVIVLLCACGSPDWVACDPGQAAFEDCGLGPNVLPFGPQPAVLPRCWCLACWPWAPSAGTQRQQARQ